MKDNIKLKMNIQHKMTQDNVGFSDSAEQD